jgi:hypothetical protein
VTKEEQTGSYPCQTWQNVHSVMSLNSLTEFAPAADIITAKMFIKKEKRKKVEEAENLLYFFSPDKITGLKDCVVYNYAG